MIQGEILRFFVIFQLKNKAVMNENALKELDTMYPKMKFSVQITKNIDAVLNLKKIRKFLILFQRNQVWK